MQYRDITFLEESNFTDYIQKEGKAFRKECYVDGFIEGFDGKPIHYVVVKHPKERAAVVIAHGFCEFVNKYDELIHYLYELGYSVFYMDHRGHGYSYRMVSDPDLVHIVDFEDYIKDFHCFVEQVVLKESNAVKLLYGHSMGGAIAARYLEEHPGVFVAAALSSPMMEVETHRIPKWLVYSMATLKKWTGKITDYVPGSHGFDHKNVFKTSGALSKARYDYVFECREKVPAFTTYGGSYGWTLAALKGAKQAVSLAKQIQVPVRLYQAGLDTMVRPKGQDEFVKRAGQAVKVEFPMSKHEIFNAGDEDRYAYFTDLFTFFDTFAK